MSAQASRHPTTVLNSFSAAARAGLVQKRSASHPTINSIAVRAAYMPATSQFHPQNSQIHDTPASVKTLHLQTKSATSRRITCAQRYKISSLLAGSAVSQQALAEARQQAREQGLTEKEISDISVSRWADSSKEKIILHGIAGLIQAKVGGTSALAGAASAIVNEAFTSIVNDYIADKLPPPKRSNYASGAEGDKAFEADTTTHTQDRKALGEISAALLGATGSALVGQGNRGIATGAGIAVTADQNNRQLHPDERKLLKSKAAEFAQKLRDQGYSSMTEERALAILIEQADNGIDATQRLRTDNETQDAYQQAEARKFLNNIGNSAGAYDDGRGNQIRYFTNTTTAGERRLEDFKNPSINAQPHVPAVDYITIQGGALGVGGSASVNLHNNEIFLGGTKGPIQTTPGASAVIGRMITDPPPLRERSDAVSDMLGGASAQGSVCVGGVCAGVNQSFGPPGRRPTAVEIGIGTPGVSGGVGVSESVKAPQVKASDPKVEPKKK